ncbi:MEDS domain-containing protein [Actinomadura kijaniata]|uniref:MEDS domain-containing protein n=1 Tax=Actinomadura kijaniata TaxID=46161 RepID=UPI0008332147|nr:MEDS domain-containing protein [Actinomadura kijaniata]
MSVLHPRLGDHLCMFTDSIDDYLDFVAVYAGNGLASGHQVKVLVDLVAPAVMTAWLQSRLPGAAGAFEQGALEVCAARDTYLKGGDFDPPRVMADFDAITRQAQSDGYPGVWATADMAWALLDTGTIARVLDFEAKCNQVLLEQRLAAVCHYERRMFDPATLRRVHAVHPFGPEGAGLRFARTTTPPGIRFTGRADAGNRESFAAVLSLLRSVTGPVTVDVTGLNLPDLHTTGELVELAADRSAPTTILATPATAARLHAMVTAPVRNAQIPVTIRTAGDAQTPFPAS